MVVTTAMENMQTDLQGKSSRISGDLLEIYYEYENFSEKSEGVFSSSSDIIQVDESGKNVAVRITARDVEGLIPSLEEMGLEMIGSEPELHLLEGWMPIEKIPQLESLDSEGLMGVLAVYAPITNVGLITSKLFYELIQLILPTYNSALTKGNFGMVIIPCLKSSWVLIIPMVWL